MPIKTLNVSMYPEPGGAGRSEADVGKAHVNLALLFDTAENAIRWMRQNGISTKDFE